MGVDEDASAYDLADLLDETDSGFSETLLHLIDRTGKKDSEIYKKANVDRKLFSKIRNNKNYKPSKSTALAFAIALELDLDETKDFIGRAGFALTHSSKFDIIVEYTHITNDMQRGAAEKIGGFMESATATTTPESPDPPEESRCKVIPFEKVG